MQSIFEFNTVIDRSACKELGVAATKKNKLFLVYMILGIFLAFVLYPITVLATGDVEFLTFACVGAVFMVMSFFAEDLTFKSSLKVTNKAVMNSNILFGFYDDYFTTQMPLQNTNSSYNLISAVYETPTAFVLFTHQTNGYILPKKDITNGDIAQFAQFISGKTGHTIVHAKKKSTAVKVFFIVGMLLAVILTTAIPLSIYDTANTKPETFTSGNITITAERSFEDYTEYKDGYEIYLENDDATVCSYILTQEDLRDNLGLEDPDLEAVARADAAYFNEDYELKKVGNKIYCTFEVDELYCLSVYEEVDGEFWITDFCCYDYLKDEYAQRFEEWAKTVVIE